MSRSAVRLLLVMLLMALSGRARTASKRPITVSDIVGMTRIAGSPYFAYQPTSGFAVFSPDGTKFVLVLFRGNVARNTNDYSLLLFQTKSVFEGGSAKTIATVSSASNRLGMFDLKWSKDNDTIYFLAAVAKEPTELYSVRCTTRKVEQLTSHETSLAAYDVSADDRTFVYDAEPAPASLLTDQVSRHGFDVSDEELSELIAGSISGKDPQLFVKRIGYGPARLLRTEGELRSGYQLSLSPNGRYVAVETAVRNVPRAWSKYMDSGIQAAFRIGFQKTSSSGIMQYELVDTQSGRVRRPLDSPAGYCPSPLWSSDSQSLLLCGVYLPLDVKNPREFEERRSKKFVVEISPSKRSIVKVGDEDMIPIAWDPRTNIVEFQARQVASGASSGLPAALFYQKSASGWERLDTAPTVVFPPRPDILVDEDLNRPPVIVASAPHTGRRAQILDLNPGLSQLALGKVQIIRWSDGFGKPIAGALYLPPNYVAGQRYPLVIQTHGFDPHGFWLDGPYSSGFAAQVLADRGIAVLQMDDIFYDSLVTRQEAERVMKTYKNAVNYLYRKGFIDRNRVGLLGFSRTCYYVEYALTHSKQRYAAAIAIDGVDAGYLQYLVAAVSRPSTASEFDVLNGAAPFGAGLNGWLRRSPGFLLDRFRTPLLIEAFGPPSVLDEWQPFAGLKRLHKPVDLLYLPGAAHVLVKPWDRLVSEEAAADWFYFWLSGKEDSSPEKAEQYRRWRELQAE